MSEVKKRKVHEEDFKAKVGLEGIRGLKTRNEIGPDYGVHPVQVGHWKKAIFDQASSLFEGKRGPQPAAEVGDAEHLYSEIGRLKIELDGLKKVRFEPAAMRRAWITPLEALAVVRQCPLVGVSRATTDAQRHPRPVTVADLLLLGLLDEKYTRRPFHGGRKMVVFLKAQGHLINRWKTPYGSMATRTFSTVIRGRN